MQGSHQLCLVLVRQLIVFWRTVSIETAPMAQINGQGVLHAELYKYTREQLARGYA